MATPPGGAPAGAAAPNWGQQQSASAADDAEQEAIAKIVNAFRAYEGDALEDVDRWEANYARLPSWHKTLLPELPAKYRACRAAIGRNAAFLGDLLRNFEPLDGGPTVPGHLALPGSKDSQQGQASRNAHPSRNPRPIAPKSDTDKVRYVLKNFVRDWSAEGAAERAEAYSPILAELTSRIPLGAPAAAGAPHKVPRVLCPGAGLGRLCMEIARLGYACEGNEFSYYMLFASSFVLNGAERANQWVIHPWVHSPCNHLTDGDQLREVRVPDVAPGGCGVPANRLSMCAGDFVEVYGGPEHVGAWDAIVTCFFIDTAHNVLEYLQVISRCLREGGHWINLGPLQYHWADAHLYLPPGELSLELSLAAVERVAPAFGLRLVSRGERRCSYTNDSRGMQQHAYNCAVHAMVKDSTLMDPGIANDIYSELPPRPH